VEQRPAHGVVLGPDTGEERHVAAGAAAHGEAAGQVAARGHPWVPRRVFLEPAYSGSVIVVGDGEAVLEVRHDGWDRAGHGFTEVGEKRTNPPPWK
jgi:hypothetical protein